MSDQRAKYLDGEFLWKMHGAKVRYRALSEEFVARGGTLSEMDRHIARMSEGSLTWLLYQCVDTGLHTATSDSHIAAQFLEGSSSWIPDETAIATLIDSLEAIVLSCGQRESLSESEVRQGSIRLRKAVADEIGVRRERQAARNRAEVERVQASRRRDEERQHAQAEADAMSRERDQAAAAARQTQERDRRTREPNDLAAHAAAALDSALTLTASVEDQVARAAPLYEQRAFSPFWEAIENAYLALGAIRAHLDAVSADAIRHAEVVGELVNAEWFEGEVGAFPSIPEISVRIEKVVVVASKLVALAQRDFEFAQIWEMRRNTAAVVEGFGSMEAAVRGMQAAMIDSLASMAASVTRSLTAAVSASKSRQDRTRGVTTSPV